VAKVRTTLNLDDDVLVKWQLIAEREGASLSSVVNSWLRQVSPAAEALASVVDEDRQATAARLQHLSSAVQAANELYRNAAHLARVAHPAAAANGAGRPGGATQEGRRAARRSPPSSNTGGKPTKARGGR